ncbi:MAG: hypothetical protein JNM07_09410 [Phycisphaerae bacterium]|nr:hypothetical protein [Phycisphaerae bacterium]
MASKDLDMASKIKLAVALVVLAAAGLLIANQFGLINLSGPPKVDQGKNPMTTEEQKKAEKELEEMEEEAKQNPESIPARG